jgi:23S rRNA (pseudouridine1915-N3)-methyltransferase
MKIAVISVGEETSPLLSQVEADYLRRVNHYGRIELVWIRGEKLNSKTDPKKAMAAEAERIRARIVPGTETVAMDRTGKAVDSETFAAMIDSWRNRGRKQIAFIIGGPFGLDANLVRECTITLSLSAMTFQHDMARLVLLEQIYRAHTILKGEPYHK